MPFIIDGSYIESTLRLDANSAQRGWEFVQKFRANPAQPGISLERVDQAAQKNLWSARVSRDLRAILYKDGEDWRFIYIGHHDDAYNWASSRQIGRHIKTGELQIVELPTVSVTQNDVPGRSKKAGIFAGHKDDYLLSLGVPPSWLLIIKAVESEDDFLNQVYPKLPDDVVERLFLLALGEIVAPPAPISEHDAAKDSAQSWRSFYLIESDDDLRSLLAAPLATWIAFLHPSQKRLATGAFNGPVKITGAAGTGKTVVALHRARHLARQGKRVLLTSFVKTLCNNLKRNLKLFCAKDELKLIDVTNVHHLAKTKLDELGEVYTPIGDDVVGKYIEDLLKLNDCPLDKASMLAEWKYVVQAQRITSWEQYRNASRAGRGRALSVKDRKQVWEIASKLRLKMKREGEMEYSALCHRLCEHLQSGRLSIPYDAVIVDEVQDLGPQELRLIATLAGAGENKEPDRLTIVGDAGQRIYPGKYSLRSLGIDVRGRSHILRLNYRTTEQIRRFADNVLGHESDDLDGGQESRRGVRSLFRGPQPALKGFPNKVEQTEFVVKEIKKLLGSGRAADEIAVFARQAHMLNPVEKALNAEGLSTFLLSKNTDPESTAINLGTMHRAKGLEFKVVFVIDADDKQLPLAKALAEATDPQLREDALARERQLLYVSATRARDELFICWSVAPSRFLPEL
jgi:hypothetical protein